MPTALITGASKGIGRQLAIRAAESGYDLVLVARTASALHELAEQLHVGCRVEPIDLTDPEAPARLYERLEAEGVQIDALINNAGFGSTGAFHTLDRERELAQIQLNIRALTDLTRLFLPAMVARGQGRVLNIASTAGFQAGPYMAVYYATKAYVLSFTEALAHELAGTGVRATAHCPGPTETHFGEVSGNGDKLLFRMGGAPAEAVARHAFRAMEAGRPIAVHGLGNWLGTVAVKLVPRALSRRVAAALNQ